MDQECPVCTSNLDNCERRPSGRDGVFYSCPACGDFFFTSSLLASLDSLKNSTRNGATKISHAIRSMQSSNQGSELYVETVEEILSRELPQPHEQVDLFIRWLAENGEDPGKTIWITPATHGPIIGATSDEGFALIIDYLFDQELVIGNQSEAMGQPGRAHIALSMNGWSHYNGLKTGSSSYRKAFMAMKFGDQVLNNVLERVFKPAVKDTGFDLLKLDDNPRAGLIDDRLRVEIQSADFILSDLTHDNLGAYWEAGYAEGLGKPVIYTCERSKFDSKKGTHFDTNHHLTIIWDDSDPAACADQLKATIRATLPSLAKQEDD